MPISEDQYEKLSEEESWAEISPALMDNEFIHWCFGKEIKRVRVSGLQKDSGCYIVRFIIIDDSIEENVRFNYPEWHDGYSYKGFCRIKKWFWLNPEEKKNYPRKK